MSHVTIVELTKLKVLLDYLIIDIIQYKKIKIIDISQFSFFSRILGLKMGLKNPRSFTFNSGKMKSDAVFTYDRDKGKT